jgi:hypothetical protein
LSLRPSLFMRAGLRCFQCAHEIMERLRGNYR